MNFKRILVLVLTFAMLMGTFAPALGIFAEEINNDIYENESDRDLVYVSIGDSMTNGYGMDGYDGESGVVNYANNTYANQFAAWLAGYSGSILDDQVIFEGANGVVDHRQLAMSGLRAEDLHWILTLDYENEELLQTIYNKWGADWTNEVKDLWFGEWGFINGDYRTWSDFCDWDYRYADAAAKILATYNGNAGNSQYFQSSFASNEAIQNAINGIADTNKYKNENGRYFPRNKAEADLIGGYKYLQIATEFYQQSVKDADVITLALGNTNFGTYMLTEIMEVAMNNNFDRFNNRYDIEDVFNLANMDPELEAQVRDLIEQCNEIIDKTFATLSEGNPEKAAALRNVIIYCIASYAVNYIGSVKTILDLNPDVEIIQIALMNAYADESESIEGITLGDMVDILYSPINQFIAAVPVALRANEDYRDAKFYYAEAESVECLVSTFGDDFYTDDNGYVAYPGLLNGTEEYTANANSVVRDRFVANIVRGQTFDMLASFGVLDTITVDQIAAYDLMTPVEKAAFAAKYPDIAKSIALYLAFENATIKAGKGTVTMESLAALNGMNVGTFSGAMSQFNANVGEAGKAYVKEAAIVVAAASNGQITPDVVTILAEGGEQAIYDYIASRSNGQLTPDVVKALYEAEDHDAFIFDFIANQSNGMLDATAVSNLYTAVMAQPDDEAKRTVIYNTLAVMANNALLDAETIKNLYLAPNHEAAIDSYIAGIVKVQVAQNPAVGAIIADGVHASFEEILACTESDAYHPRCAAVKAAYTNALTNAMNNYKGLMLTVVNGVDQLWKAAHSVDSLKGVISNVSSLKYALESANNLCYLLAIPDTLSNAMTADSTVSGILCMNARVQIGTGIGGHPSQGGHDSVYAAVKDCYENDWTSEKQTIKNAYELVLEYYDEAYAAGYGYADENGYIDISVEAIEKAIDAIEVAIDEVNGGLLGTTDELTAKLVAELEATKETLEELRNVLATDSAKDVEGLVAAVFALEDDLYRHLTNVYDILAQAGIDVNQLVILPAINEAIRVINEEVIPAVVAAAEAFAEAVVEYVKGQLEAFYSEVLGIAKEVYDQMIEALVRLQLYAQEKIENAIKPIINAYCELVETLTEIYGSVEEAVRVAGKVYGYLAELNAKLDGAIAGAMDKVAEMFVRFYEVYGNVEDALNALNEVLMNVVNNVDVAVDKVIAAYNVLVEKLVEIYGTVEEALNKANEIYNDIKNTVDGAVADALEIYNTILNVITNAYGTVENAITVAGQIFSYAYDFVKENLTEEELKELYDDIVGIISEAYGTAEDVYEVATQIYAYLVRKVVGAFEGNYHLTADSMYVSLGNAVYGEELAGMLNLGNKYYNYGLNGNYLDKIDEADLITVRFDNGETIAIVMSNIQGTANLDWNKYLDAEGQAALEELIESLKAEIVASGMAIEFINAVTGSFNLPDLPTTGEELAEIAGRAVEGLIYSYAEFISRIEVTLDNVYTTAPEATVVITGIQNPVAGIDLGEYTKVMDAVMMGFNSQLIAIALANDNTIFVDSVDAQDIYDALNVSCDHVYDNCEDTVCNICGGEREALEHSFTNYVYNNDAKCGVNGTKTAVCNFCDITDTIEAEGTALDHDWTEASCSAPKTCKLCGATEGETLPHTFGDWVVTVEPTKDSEGVKERECTVCHIVETATIPMLESMTPIETAAVIIGAVVAVAGVGAGVCLFIKKRRAQAQ